MDSTRRPNISGAGRERQQWRALWRAVSPEPEPHPVDAAVLGEFAVFMHRRGLEGATQAFPQVAKHLGLVEPRTGVLHLWHRQELVDYVRRHCRVCAAHLDELLRFAEAEWGPRRPLPGERPYHGAPAYHRVADEAPSIPAPAMLRVFDSDLSGQRRTGDVARTYEVGASTITLRFGDIVSSHAEALVSSDDGWLTMGGGVSQALGKAAGASLRVEARKLVATAPAQVGDVVVTSAGRLRAKYVLHAITIGTGLEEIGPDAIVRHAVRKVMRLVPLLGCRSVAFPAIGTGVAGIPFEVAAAEMGQALVTALRDGRQRLAVELYLLDIYGGRTSQQLFEYFEASIRRTLGLAALPDRGAYRLAVPDDEPAGGAGAGRAGVASQREIVRMLRDLDARRGELEAALIRGVVAKEPEDDERLVPIRRQLAELRALRESYEVELTGVRHPGAAAPAVPRSVFLSSTWTDLQPHRTALKELVERLQFRFVGMEDFTPAPEPPGILIRRKVDQAAIYLGVLGMRYGAVDAGTGLSMTELEYRQAVASNKHIQMFVMDDKAPITVDMVETDPERYAKLCDFRQRVLQSHVCGLFLDVGDLVAKAERALREVPL
ncbi:MAG: macro domain-containing protein [Chloroflexi bacterium]|nr:macro domain-containing protein [Chloroflexota bacterium]